MDFWRDAQDMETVHREGVNAGTGDIYGLARRLSVGGVAGQAGVGYKEWLVISVSQGAGLPHHGEKSPRQFLNAIILAIVQGLFRQQFCPKTNRSCPR